MGRKTKLILKNINIANICLITILWTVMVIMVNPIGDFPLNDDWAYGWSVKILLEKGEFQLSDWTAINLLSQVMWGGLFCLPFGFSFTALRFSTLTLGLIGIIATYGLLREVKTSPKVSLVGALIIALNPIYFGLSNSFMSDVPSFAFTIVSLYFLVRAVKRDSRFDLAMGLVVCFISILNRQTGLLILPAFGFAYLMKKGLKPRHIIEASFPSILGLALYLAYPQWLDMTGKTPYSYNNQTHLLLESLSSGLVNIVSTYTGNISRTSIYLGLFLLPYLVLNLFGSIKFKNLWQNKMSFFSIVVTVVIVAMFAAKYQRLPSIGNILDVAGIGPSTISGSASGSDSLSTIHRRIWQFMTVLGVAGAALLFRSFLCAGLQVFVFSQERDLNIKCSLALIISAICLYLLPIGALPKGYWFDRYLLVFLPLLMMLVSTVAITDIKRTIAPWAVSTCLIMLLFNGWFTVSATHDYLSWNRVRWQAINNVMQESQISLNQVNGGGAFRGWYFGNRLEICNPEYREGTQKKSITWNEFTCLRSKGNEKLAVSLVANKGYQIEKQYSFRRWLFLREQHVYVLSKNTSNEENYLGVIFGL